MADFLLTSDPKSITPAQYRQILREFIEERLFSELESLVLRISGPSEHFKFEVSCNDLLDFDPSLGFNVIHFPKLILPIFDEAVFEAQTNLCAHPSLEAKHSRKGTVKPHCHIRIVALPPTESLNKPTISNIRADDVDSLIQISGKVVRTGAVRMLEVSKKYECQNPRCQYRFTIMADPEQDNMLPQPRSCPCPSSDAPGGGSGKKCQSTNLRELEGYRVCVDYQELKIQDSFERVSLGSIPRSIVVILEADLVDKFNAGDDVVIVGVLVRQWKPVYKKARCSVEIALRANSMLSLNAQDRLRLVTNETVSQFESFWEPYREKNCMLEGRDVIIRSICPQLYGLFFVKLALLLTLVGGSVTQSDRGVKRRSQSHLLVVGDPGCGKSQILRFAASVVLRSVLTTGIGTSGAGLTCTAVRDGSDWSLEAGALVLANDGVCCIDEFASIKDQDRVTIHEAMEQQSISVAKAGLVVKLNTRATVLACCNPKGTYDITADISTNTAIASPLLSRFDLVLVLLDAPQKDWDKRVSTFLLQQAVNAGKARTGSGKGKSKGKHLGAGHDMRTGGSGGDDSAWSLLKLRDYIAYVKSTFQPVMSAEAKQLLMRYYQIQRQSEDRSQGRTTVRLLESLMRLSEAHAKIMSRDTVLLQDAVVAVACVNLSQEQTSLLDANSTLHSDFPSDSKKFYSEQEAKVFALLHCTKRSLLRDAALESAQSRGPGSAPSSVSVESMISEGRGDVVGADGGGAKVAEERGAVEMFQVTAAASFSADLAGDGFDGGSSTDVGTIRTSNSTGPRTAESKAQPSLVGMDPNPSQLSNGNSHRDVTRQLGGWTAHSDNAPSLDRVADSDGWNGQSSSVSSMPGRGDSWGASGSSTWDRQSERIETDLGHRGERAEQGRLRQNHTGDNAFAPSSAGSTWTSASTDLESRWNAGSGSGVQGPQHGGLGGQDDIWGPAPAPAPVTGPAPPVNPAVRSLQVPRGLSLTQREDSVELPTQPSLSSSRSQPLPQRAVPQPSYTPRSQQHQPLQHQPQQLQQPQQQQPQQQQQQFHLPHRIPLKTTAVKVSRAEGQPTPPRSLPRLPPGMHRAPSNSPSARPDGTMPPPSSSPATRKRFRTDCPSDRNIETENQTKSFGVCMDSEEVEKTRKVENWEQGRGQGQAQGQTKGQCQGQVQGPGRGPGQGRGQGHGQDYWQGPNGEQIHGEGVYSGGRVSRLVPEQHVYQNSTLPARRAAADSLPRDTHTLEPEDRVISESLWGGAETDYGPSPVTAPAPSAYPGSMKAPDPAAPSAAVLELPHFEAMDEEEW